MKNSSTRRTLRAITNVMAFLLCTTTSNFVQAKPDLEKAKESTSGQKIYFTLSDKHSFPLEEEMDSFGCSDKIYTVANLTSWPMGKYSITFVWTDPSGTDRERVEYDFHVRKEETRLWSWISLKRATGAGMLQWLNPAAGLEEFIGEWEVHVFVDNKILEKGSFEVIC